MCPAHHLGDYCMATDQVSRLNTIWRRAGTGRLIQDLRQLALADHNAALRALNVDALIFPVFYIVLDEVDVLGLASGLTPRNAAAAWFCARRRAVGWNETAPPDADALVEALRWMLATGKGWDGPRRSHDEYDALLDEAAAQLTVTYHDKATLGDIADLIFLRNRKGLYLHDLVWSFFQTVDRPALDRIAKPLLSGDAREARLAAKLLHINLPESPDPVRRQNAYEQYVNWLDDNAPYLYVTGEHLQMTNSPRHLDCDDEAKYLHKPIEPRKRTPVEPLTDEERASLAAFRQTTDDEQALLTAYSHQLYERNHAAWQAWMKKDAAEQVLAAGKDYEAV